VRDGDPYERWDLHVAAGALGGIRLRALVEEHGRGRQLARFRLAPRVPRAVAAAAPALAAVAAGASAGHAWLAAAAVGTAAAALLVGAAAECGIAIASALRALEAS
jgi:hypothetical protein